MPAPIDPTRVKPIPVSKRSDPSSIDAGPALHGQPDHGRGLPGQPRSSYPGVVFRRVLSVLVSATCAVSAPSLAWASAPKDTDEKADALFTEGKYLEAAQLQTEALDALPERLDSRNQRNLWATGAVNAYRRAFAADPTQCAAATAGLSVADDYLKGLIVAYGAQVMNADEYTGVQRLRGLLDEARVQLRCPAPEAAPASVPSVVDQPKPSSDPSEVALLLPVGTTTPKPVQVQNSSPPPKPSGRGLAAGVGVSATVAVGMAITSIVAYTQVRGPGAKFYDAIQNAATAEGISTGSNTDMCVAGNGIAAVIDACNAWTSRTRLYYATGILSGIFAISTAVFTGFLVHKRRSARPTAFLRKHQVQLGAAPRPAGGVSLSAGFRF